MDSGKSLVYSAFKLTEPIELFEEALLEILGIQRQITLANTIAVSLYPVTFPAPNLLTVGLKKPADEGLLLWALFLSVKTDWKALLFDWQPLSPRLTAYSSTVWLFKEWHLK